MPLNLCHAGLNFHLNSSPPLRGLHAPSTKQQQQQHSRRCTISASSKKGIGTFTAAFNDSALKALQPEVTWYYTWSATKHNVAGDNSTADCYGMEYVPMIWGVDKGPRKIDSELAKDFSGAKYLLGFNEPDGYQPGQSSVDVQKAIEQWPKLVKKAADYGMQLGSPATSEPATRPGGWMENFMSQGPHVDFVCAHWYPTRNELMLDTDKAARELADYITAVYQKYGKRVWLTEFSLIDYSASPQYTPDREKLVAFARAAVYKLEGLDCLERYAWYSLPHEGMHANNGLFENNGEQNKTGTAYKYAHGPNSSSG